VAEDGFASAGEDGGHPATVVGDMWPAHHIDPAMEGVQPSRPDPVVDRLRCVPDLAQLIAGDHPVLIPGQIPRLTRHPHPFFPSLIRRLMS